MSLLFRRIMFILSWAVVIAVAVPLSVVVAPFILMANIPKVLKDGWPREILRPKKNRIQSFIPVADSIFSQN